ncbi:MAG TPA: PrsW family glutamic-type intramembrane protease [Candidatus Eisenbacteria bacterium]|nr:PrsW family glutamic-type intramembrane protease [Candidatus Eisenbacteria bacterium]
MNVLHLLLGFAPVTAFLAALVLLDSFKLVRGADVAKSLVAGVLAAAVSLLANVAAVRYLGVAPDALPRFLAPLVEESAKAATVFWLVRSGRLGFLVDAAIHGFALGTGFALLENLYYAHTMGTESLGLWVVRGLGTAVMHGTTTAIFAILGKGLTERNDSRAFRWFLPGFAVALAIHVGFNHFILPPLVSTAILLAVMPTVLGLVFERSERATRDWLGAGMDRDVEALEQILSGEVVETRVGQYLSELRSRLPGAVVADMLCMLRVQLELSLRAKGMMMARAAGIEIPMDPSVRENLDELRFLEKSIGPTGILALKPLLRGRERWEQELLGG